MKDKIIKILLVVFIIVHAAAPWVELASVGYDGWSSLLLNIYENGIIVVLSAAVLRLYNSKDEDE